MSFRDNSFVKLFDKGNVYQIALDTMQRYSMDKMVKGGVLIGLSGGADSVMLLYLLLEYRKRECLNFTIVACHVNHLIRGEEAYRDCDFSRMLCKSLGVEFISFEMDVPAYARENKLGIEEAARNIRYSAFADIISGRNDLSCIALAHNSSDNLETVIFNMMRGAGLSGMCGIPPVRDNIIRPLIRISKADIVSTLDSGYVNYVHDSTNSETDYSRNYIRHEIVPRLLRLNPEPENAVSRLTESLYYDNLFLSDKADKLLSSVLNKEEFSIELLRTLDYPILTRTLSALVTKRTGLKPSMQLLSDIIACIYSDNFSYSIGNGFVFLCERGIVSIVSDCDKFKDYAEYPLVNGSNSLDLYDALVVISNGKEDISSNVYNFSIHIDVPSAIINGGLYLRFRRDGDAYRYGGMTHRLKKVFNDRDILPSVRDRIPLICDADGILWVPGLPVRDGKKETTKSDTVRITIFYSTDNNKNRRIYTARRADPVPIERLG